MIIVLSENYHNSGRFIVIVIAIILVIVLRSSFLMMAIIKVVETWSHRDSYRKGNSAMIIVLSDS